MRWLQLVDSSLATQSWARVNCIPHPASAYCHVALGPFDEECLRPRDGGLPVASSMVDQPRGGVSDLATQHSQHHASQGALSLVLEHRLM